MRYLHQYGIDTKGRNSDGKIKNICPQCSIFFVLLNIKKDCSCEKAVLYMFYNDVYPSGLCNTVSRYLRCNLLDQTLQYSTWATFCEVGSTIRNHIFNSLCPAYRSC